MWASARFWSAITAPGRAALLAVSLLVAVSAPAAAQLFSPEQIAQINRVQTYLNALTTLESRFVQVDPNGYFAEGSLFISRPGKMRFEYDPPTPLLLVADGTWFIHVDKELEEVSHIPLSSTPAAFLLREEIRLDSDYQVRGVSAGKGLVTLEIVERENPEAGAVEVVFEDQPLRLKQWTITDAQGLDTRVTLTGSRFGGALDDGLFRFKNPWLENEGRN